MRPTLPTVEQVTTLPRLLHIRIPAEWQDVNGHVNIQHYMHMYDAAGYPWYDTLGATREYIRSAKWGMFDLEHHLWYLRELHVGDEVSLHCRLIDRTQKRFHGVMFLVNRTRGELASAMEFVSTGANLQARATAAIPDAIAAVMDAQIQANAALDWQAPVCGVMAP